MFQKEKRLICSGVVRKTWRSDEEDERWRLLTWCFFICAWFDSAEHGGSETWRSVCGGLWFESFPGWWSFRTGVDVLSLSPRKSHWRRLMSCLRLNRLCFVSLLAIVGAALCTRWSSVERDVDVWDTLQEERAAVSSCLSCRSDFFSSWFHVKAVQIRCWAQTSTKFSFDPSTANRTHIAVTPLLCPFSKNTLFKNCFR